MQELSRRSVLGATAGAALVQTVAAGGAARAADSAAARQYADLPSLDLKQSGQLRHAHNIAQQLPGDYTYMQGPDPDNIGDFEGYRWQLKFMMQAQALAYKNYLPAAPGAFKADYKRLMDKLLCRDCWNYWATMSRFSKATPPVGIAPGEGWWDPIVKENIFYSGIVVSMAAQYAYLFNDHSYDRMGSIAFDRPHYAKGPQRVEYSLPSALDTIYWQMVENGYLGVACQPDSVFNSCSQMPIEAMRFEDFRHGTQRADEVITNHREAWRRLGGYIDGKPMPTVHLMSANKTVNIPWGLGYFVFNNWNPEYFRSTYPMTKASILRKDANGRIEVYAMAQYGETEKAFLEGLPQPPVKRESKGGQAVAGAHGTVALFLAEAGDPDVLTLLKQVDAHMNPTWANGGLYYPRRDADWDDEGNVIGVAPTASHAYGLARLDGGDGLHDLFANPMPKTRWDEPYLADVSPEVDVARAVFVEADNRLVLRVRPPHGAGRSEARLTLANAKRPGQGWTLAVNGRKMASGATSGAIDASTGRAEWQQDNLVATLPVTRPTDIVMSWT